MSSDNGGTDFVAFAAAFCGVPQNADGICANCHGKFERHLPAGLRLEYTARKGGLLVANDSQERQHIATGIHGTYRGKEFSACNCFTLQTGTITAIIFWSLTFPLSYCAGAIIEAAVPLVANGGQDRQHLAPEIHGTYRGKELSACGYFLRYRQGRSRNYFLSLTFPLSYCAGAIIEAAVPLVANGGQDRQNIAPGINGT